MKILEKELKIKYHWTKSNGGEIRDAHVEALDESAKDRIFGMINKGYIEGELHDNVFMDAIDDTEDEIEGIEYSGYWRLT